MTAQQYRHFALYFESSAALIGTEEYDTQDEMIAVVDEWLEEFRNDHAVELLDYDKARTSMRVLVHSAFTVEGNEPRHSGVQDVILCSIPVVQSKHSVVVSDANGITEHGPFDVETEFHVHGSVVYTKFFNTAAMKFEELSKMHGAKTVEYLPASDFPGQLGFTKQQAKVGSGKNKVTIELVVVPPNKPSALAPQLVTI